MSVGPTSIATLYAVEQGRLRAYLIRRGLSASAAADVVQEAFIRLMRAPREDVRDPRRYLRRVVTTVAIDTWRAERRASAVIDATKAVDESVPDAALQAESALISAEELAALNLAILELSPRVRQVLMLHRYDGLSYAEVADRLGISKNTVMVHLARAIGTLRRRMRENSSSLD